MGHVDRPKVFVIGLNKTATTSIHRAFKESGYISRHCADENGRFIAKIMQTNVLAKRPILSGISYFDVLSDFTYCDDTQVIEAVWYFRELYAEYPEAYFLLNLRDRESWIRSRRNHAGLVEGKTFLERAMSAYGVSEDEVELIWGNLHEQFHREVKTYFANTTANFLEYDILTDRPDKITDWLGSHYDLPEHVWVHAAKGVPGGDKRSALRKSLSRLKWSLLARLK